VTMTMTTIIINTSTNPNVSHPKRIQAARGARALQLTNPRPPAQQLSRNDVNPQQTQPKRVCFIEFNAHRRLRLQNLRGKTAGYWGRWNCWGGALKQALQNGRFQQNVRHQKRTVAQRTAEEHTAAEGTAAEGTAAAAAVVPVQHTAAQAHAVAHTCQHQRVNGQGQGGSRREHTRAQRGRQKSAGKIARAHEMEVI